MEPADALTHPVALVVGASRGLGLLVARELCERGHHVVIAARSAGELESAVPLVGPSERVTARVVDIRDRAQVKALVDDVEATVGPIEVLMTVAGIIQAGPAESVTLEHFDDAIATMLTGPIALTWAVLPAMRGRGRGRIGTVTSIGGMVSPPHLLPYATAKFGAVGFSDGLAASLSGTGITATTIVPGLMRTGSHERATFTGDPEAEYAWFAPGAALPLLSIDADRAARRMVDATLAGRPMVVLTPLAQVGIRVRGLMPGVTTRLMGVGNRLLPDAPPGGGETRPVLGRHAAPRLRPAPRRVVEALTTLGRSAARRNNQR